MGNLDKAEDCVMDVSDPDSLNYGKHWTAQQVQDFFRPTDETIDAVRQWIEETIARDIDHTLHKGHLRFMATTSELESLLETEYHYHHHDLVRRGVPATDIYHVPEHVRRHLDYITPGIVLPKVNKRSPSNEEPGEASIPPIQERDLLSARDIPCNVTGMSPQCIKKLYGIPDTPPKAVAGYEHAIYSTGNDPWDQLSLDTFFSTQTNIPKGTHPKSYNIAGAPEPEAEYRGYVEETNIDLDVTYPLLYPAEIVLLNEGPKEYQTNNAGYMNLMLDALDASYCTYTAYGETGDYPGLGGEVKNKDCGTINPPKVIASSWDATEDYIPLAYQRRQCNEFMKLTLQGVSFIYAVGDWGIANGGHTCYGPKGDMWGVPWPANCPYVTGVGGTQIKDGADPTDPDSSPEEALDGRNPQTLWQSSGGISAVYDRPSWQSTAVGGYLDNTKIDALGFAALAPDLPMPQALNTTIHQIYQTGVKSGEYGHYSTLGRGVPDISALGDHVYVRGNGHTLGTTGGTSAAVHVVASMISRINLERMYVGKGPVGFLNPTLYKYADKFIRDITDGRPNGNCDQPGFPVAKGWDPVTGLGVLKYKEALEFFLSLP
ncbi:unnamed protein product [Zymoseptoria tritici ST99CH_3D1]|nr:unnamed protein product [Zymoseptoria tritici ST99CH_3D1]